ncbi:MAG: hypothetical protein AB1599_05130 [Planctomycetota bacterium]
MNNKPSLPKAIFAGFLLGLILTGAGRFFLYINGPLCSVGIGAIIGIFMLILGVFPTFLIFGELEYTTTTIIFLLIIQGVICSVIAFLVMLVREKITKSKGELSLKGLVLRVFVIYIMIVIVLFMVLSNIRVC